MKRNALTTLYLAWVEDNCPCRAETEEQLQEISSQLDSTNADSDVLAQYEELARRSGFEAGFWAALDLMMERGE